MCGKDFVRIWGELRAWGDVRSGPSRSRAAGQRHAPLARKPPARVGIAGSRCVRVDYGGFE